MISRETVRWNGVSRRSFIFSGLAATCAAYVPAASTDRPTLKFGVTSDIHVTDDGTRARRYEQALRLFKRRDADAVMVCGDIADWGTVKPLSMCAMPGGACSAARGPCRSSVPATTISRVGGIATWLWTCIPWAIRRTKPP